MTEKKKNPKRRTRVKDLPEAEKNLTGNQMKKVKGGTAAYRESDFNFAIKAGDGSVKPGNVSVRPQGTTSQKV